MTAIPSLQPTTLDQGLDISDLSVSYGGNQAVAELSLSAPLARITGLIGPNGAGKTTIFNACSGLVKPRSGTIRLFGTDVTSRSPGARARLGLGRTFQRVEVCNNMTVRANVALGPEARSVGSNPLRQIRGSAAERRAIQQATDEALEECEITGLAERQVAALSTGQRRLVELARVLAAGFDLVMLDEPSSGLDDEETECFGEILTRVATVRDLSILLVEHDMALVMAVCAYIYVLDFGRLIFEGTVSQTVRSDVVRAAYLGDDMQLEAVE